MKKLFLTASIAGILLFNSCSTVPLTGRSRLDLVSNDQVLPMAFQAYGEFLNENKATVLPASSAQALKVKTIGSRLITAVQSYMNSNNYGNLIKDYKWEVNVVQNNEKNAWCMPGGKIVVYTGILPVTQDDAGLATVMGHEIAHAIAGHSAERMSQEMAAQGLGAVAGELNQLFNSAYHNAVIGDAKTKNLNSSEFFFYAKPQLNVVAYDATIQGSLFKNNSPLTFGVKPVVFEQQFGVNYSSKRFTADFNIIFKTKEVKSVAKAQNYGGLSLYYRFGN